MADNPTIHASAVLVGPKAVLIRGGCDPFDLLDDTAVAALAVRSDGSIETSPGWRRFVGADPDRTAVTR